MPGLTESRLAVVKSLIDAAPDAVVRNLDMALSADASDGAMAIIRELVGVEARARRARAMTFGPLISLCPRTPSIRHECFPQRAPTLLWKAMAADFPDEAEAALGAADSIGQAMDPAPFDVLCRLAGTALREQNPSFTPVRDLVGEDADRLATYLDLVPIIRPALAQLPEWLMRMTEERTASLRLAFRDAVAVSPDAGPMFFDLLIAQMDEPWAVLRLVSALMDRPTDIYVNGTELAHIGLRLIEECDERLEALRNFDPQDGKARGLIAGEDARIVVSTLAEFCDALDIKREGPWGGKIAKQKRELAQIVELRLAKVEEAVDQAMPLRMVKVGGRLHRGAPKLHQDPDLKLVQKAEGLLAFLDKTRVSAAHGGYAAMRGKIVEHLQTRLEQYTEDLIDELRNEQSEVHARARQYLELCAEFTGYVMDAKAAQIVRRRAAA